MTVTFRPEARNDLRDILRFVFEKSRDIRTARAFAQRIKDRCERIGHAPYSGRPRDDLEVGLRTVSFERNAVIAYTISEGRVRITNIFYGGRDFERLFDPADPQD